MHRSECPEKVEPKQRAHSKSTLCRTSGHKLSERQSGHCIKTSRLVCIANLLTVFYMMATLVFNELICCTPLRCTCTCKYQELTACYYSKAFALRNFWMLPNKFREIQNSGTFIAMWLHSNCFLKFISIWLVWVTFWLMLVLNSQDKINPKISQKNVDPRDP